MLQLTNLLKSGMLKQTVTVHIQHTEFQKPWPSRQGRHNKTGEMWKDSCPTLVNPLKEFHIAAPAHVWKQDSSAHVGLSPYQQVSPVTARPQLDLKGNSIKYTGYSQPWITGKKSKYQRDLSFFCWMKHQFPVSRYHQVIRVKGVTSLKLNDHCHYFLMVFL